MYLTADVNYYIVATGWDRLKDVKFCTKIIVSNKYRHIGSTLAIFYHFENEFSKTSFFVQCLSRTSYAYGTD